MIQILSDLVRSRTSVLLEPAQSIILTSSESISILLSKILRAQAFVIEASTRQRYAAALQTGFSEHRTVPESCYHMLGKVPIPHLRKAPNPCVFTKVMPL